MSFIQDFPRTLALNQEMFTVGDIQYLKTLFPQMHMAVLPKDKIRSDTILQKAIRAGAILCNLVQTTGNTAMLSVTQDGRALLGIV